MSGEDKNDADRRESLETMQKLGPLFNVGIQMASAVVIMFFLGRWLDDTWGTTPWVMLAGIIIGCGAGMIQFIKVVSDVNKEESKSQDPRK